jgi:AcrR family transcriptional regulator
LLSFMANYHHGDLHQALLDAAFVDPDPANLSLRKLAETVGVTPAAVYRHFESREQLLAALAAHAFGLLNARFAKAMDLAKPPATATAALRRMEKLGEAYLAFAEEEPALWRLMFGASGAQYRTSAAPANRPNTGAYLPAALNELHRTGHLPRAPSAQDEFFAWACIHGAATLRQGQLNIAAGPARKVAAAMVERIVCGLGGEQKTVGATD